MDSFQNTSLHAKNKLYFYHMRKCGGTSLRRALKKYCEKQDLEFEVTEGYPIGSNQKYFPGLTPDMVINHQLNDIRQPLFNQIIWVTNLRNPIDRVYSLYLENAENLKTKSVREFILENKDSARKNFYWTVTSNYFVKTLTNHMGEVGKVEYQKAHDLLNRFDCIFFLDQNTKWSKGLFHFLKIPHMHKLQNRNSLYTQFQAEFDEVRPLVQELNEWDLKLYEYFLKKALLTTN